VTVLVVDDAAFMRQRLRRLLEEAGYTVAEAVNGQDAQAVYARVRPQIVLMDITMPEVDGIAATTALCRLDPDARVVIVSALGQQAMVLQALAAGAKDFVVKPFQPPRILEAVRKWAKPA